MTASLCRWCSRVLAVGRQPKTFCNASCRGAFHEACRRMGERLFADGAVTIEQLRNEEGASA